MQWVSSPFIKASYKMHYWKASPARSHCLSSIFTHYILNSPPPTKIISSLHKIQIIGEWHDLSNLKRLMADVKAQGEACFSCWFLPLAGWLALLLNEGPHPLAYQPRNTVDILTGQSLFSNYFTHNGSRCAQPHPVHSVSGIKINLRTQEETLRLNQSRYEATDKVQYQHNPLYNLTFIWGIGFYAAIYFLFYWLSRQVLSLSSSDAPIEETRVTQSPIWKI